MRRKLKAIVAACLLLDVVFLFTSRAAFLVATGIYILACACCAVVLVLNGLYKRTNHWKNKFLFERNFISNSGYRDNLVRNLDVVNVGSNPALFGLFYEGVRGQNWATGSQGLEMDLEILKYFHSYVRDGGTVLIPIMPFTAISQYIKTKDGYWDDSYYMKFAKILDPSQALGLPNGRRLLLKLRFPLVFNPLLAARLLADSPPDRRLEIADQTMGAAELEQDADAWIRGWKREFDADEMEDFVNDPKYLPYREESMRALEGIVEYCASRELRPVLLTIPVSRPLAEKFDGEFRKGMIYDFVNDLVLSGTEFLDYMFDDRFGDPSLFNGSFFLNLRGRKAFSEQVMADLGLR